MIKSWKYTALLSIPILLIGCSPKPITNFEECLSAGNPAMESYPRQCRTLDDRLFMEDIGNQFEKDELIRVDTILPNDVIEEGMTITGEARGIWFFEGSFPIVVTDENNNELGIVIAQAQDGWMTEDFVPFEALLDVSFKNKEHGNLLFKKDNPSDMPELDDVLRIPVLFE